MDENTKKALRNIAIFTVVKFGLLYAIRKAIVESWKSES